MVNKGGMLAWTLPFFRVPTQALLLARASKHANLCQSKNLVKLFYLPPTCLRTCRWLLFPSKREFSVNAAVFFACKLGNFGNSKLRHINPKRLLSNGISAYGRECPPTNQGWTNRTPKGKATSRLQGRLTHAAESGRLMDRTLSLGFRIIHLHVGPQLSRCIRAHIFIHKRKRPLGPAENWHVCTAIFDCGTYQSGQPLQLLLRGHKFQQLTSL